MAVVKKGIKQLIADAAARSRGISIAEAQKRVGREDTLFVDIRDVRELEREGMIPGAFHAPRGMLEFWVDPESPYYKPVFTEGKTYVLYCQSDWRGTLAAAALSDMGMENVLHLEGGFSEWKKAGGPTAPRPPHQAKPKE